MRRISRFLRHCASYVVSSTPIAGNSHVLYMYPAGDLNDGMLPSLRQSVRRLCFAALPSLSRAGKKELIPCESVASHLSVLAVWDDMARVRVRRDDSPARCTANARPWHPCDEGACAGVTVAVIPAPDREGEFRKLGKREVGARFRSGRSASPCRL